MLKGKFTMPGTPATGTEAEAEGSPDVFARSRGDHLPDSCIQRLFAEGFCSWLAGVGHGIRAQKQRLAGCLIYSSINRKWIKQPRCRCRCVLSECCT